MTVWIENPFDNLPGEGARAGRYEALARAFADRGHRVVWWTSDFSHARKCRRALADGVSLPEGIGMRLVPTRPYRTNVSFARILSHRAYARTWLGLAVTAGASERPDLLIASAPPLSTGAAALRLRDRFGCRLVVDVQDLWPESFARLLPQCVRPLSRILFAPLRRAARRLYAAADLVTGVSESYGAHLKSLGARDYAAFPLGIPLGDARPARPVDASAPAFAYVGNLGRGYDLMTVLRALETLPRATLDVAGAGEGEPALRTYAAAHGLAARVRLHGYLGGDALRRMLASCSVGVIPMRDDSFVAVPNKLADYAEASLAVVSSLGGETASLLARYGCGATYAPGDPQDLVRAVAALAPDAGSRARRLAEDRFDAAAISARYVVKSEGRGRKIFDIIADVGGEQGGPDGL